MNDICFAESSTMPRMWQQLAVAIETQLGIYFPEDKWPALASRVTKISARLGYKSLHAFCQSLLTAPLCQKQIELLARELTVGETYFFRDRNVFETLEHNVLPALISRRADIKRLRIWCAGCASGEEAYSVAVMLKRLIVDIDSWDVKIIATDINTQALNKARSGAYGDWSFRHVFDKAELGQTKWDVFYVDESIKSLVDFQYHNLIEPSYPRNLYIPCDLVLCRNVLMYFNVSRAHAVLKHLMQAMANDAYLFVSTVELPNLRLANTQIVHFANGSLALARNSFASCKNKLTPAVTLLHTEPDKNEAEQINKESVIRQQVACSSGKNIFDADHKAIACQHKPESAANKASEPCPDHAAMAKILADKGNYQQALTHCQMAISNDRLNPSLYLLRAAISDECGLKHYAATYLRQCLFLAPDSIIAHFNLANFRYRQRNIKEARLHWDSADRLLQSMEKHDVVEDGNGLTAGQLRNVIESCINLVTQHD